jgi:hypothetical protein
MAGFLSITADSPQTLGRTHIESMIGRITRDRHAVAFFCAHK